MYNAYFVEVNSDTWSITLHYVSSNKELYRVQK
jgi:hypothetical protein